VIHPTAPSFVKQAHVPLGAATAREKHKDSLYLDRCRRQGMLFYPLVFETFGGFGRRLLSFIKLLVEEASSNGTTSLRNASPAISYPIFELLSAKWEQHDLIGRN
jgi:hypothetical protein